MKRLAALVACAALAASAQSFDDFRDHAPIALPAKAPLYRIALPEAAYRDTRPDLGDVRVFNARGEPVPIALATEPEPAREALPPVRLAVFPLASLAPQPMASRLKVQLADGTWLAIDADARAAVAERRVAAYLLDASALKAPMHALLLDWEVLPTQEVIRVRVEGSDDLREWRLLAGPTSLVRTQQDGRKLEQPRVPLAAARAKYLRLACLDAPFTLKSVFAEFEERASPADLAVKRVEGASGARPGEAVYDLGGRLPVEGVRVIPADANAVIAANLFVRDGADGTPSWVAQSTFYRLTRDGGEIESPATHIRPRAARYWIVRADPDKGGFGATLPQLEVRWRAAQIVFVARGDEPFTLAFGNRAAKSALLPVSSMLPAYEPHAEMKLPAAAVGAVTRTASARDHWPEWMQDVSPKKLALWLVLIGAVLLLAFMAWRLHKSASD